MTWDVKTIHQQHIIEKDTGRDRDVVPREGAAAGSQENHGPPLAQYLDMLLEDLQSVPATPTWDEQEWQMQCGMIPDAHWAWARQLMSRGIAEIDDDP